MKKIVVISDIQLHCHQNWSTVEDNGLNSRLLDGISTLEQATELADGGMLVVAGDFFHDSRAIDIAVLHEAGKWINWARKRCDKIVIAAGNHDHSRKIGNIHSLETFRHSNVEIVDDWQSYWLKSGSGDKDDYFSARSPDPIFVAAFTEDIDKLRKRLADQPDQSICLLHQDVKGGKMNGGRVCESGLTIGELERFKLVLLGHFHEPQELAPNIHYIGSPYQIDKGEMGNENRVAVLEDGELTWVPTVGTPQYKVVHYDAFRAMEGAYENHFWEVVCNDEQRALIAETPPIANYKVVGTAQEASKEAEEAVGSISVAEAVTTELEKAGAGHLVTEALSRLPS